MTTFDSLPVLGYGPQSDEVIARGHAEIAFISLNRAIFEPTRMALDGEDSPLA